MKFDLICLILILLLFFTALFTPKLNIAPIVVNHFKTLKKHGNKNLDKDNFFVFILIPILLSVILSIKVRIDSTKIGLIITAFSIFVGFLLNFLILLCDVSFKNNEKCRHYKESLEKKLKEGNRRINSQERSQLEFYKNKKELIIEIYSNINFLILISIFIILFCFPYIFSPTILIDFKRYIKIFFNFIIINFSTVFLLTIIMVLKRVHLLLKSDLDEE